MSGPESLATRVSVEDVRKLVDELGLPAMQPWQEPIVTAAVNGDRIFFQPARRWGMSTFRESLRQVVEAAPIWTECTTASCVGARERGLVMHCMKCGGYPRPGFVRRVTS